MKQHTAGVILGAAIPISLAISTTGCSTLYGVQDERGEGGAGVIKIYDANYYQLWDTVIEVVDDAGIDVVSADRQRGEILATHTGEGFSYGENIAIYIISLDPGGFRNSVEVISKPFLKTTIFAPNWEKLIFEELDSKITP